MRPREFRGHKEAPEDGPGAERACRESGKQRRVWTGGSNDQGEGSVGMRERTWSDGSWSGRGCRLIEGPRELRKWPETLRPTW